MKKIISYSLYGSDSFYIQGAIRNAEMCPAVFPGWRCRFYVSEEISDAVIDELKSLGAEVVQRQRKDGIDGMFWRFEVASDPEIEAMIVRDTDSRLTKRDKIAVDTWLSTGKKFHFIRDHPSHRKPILAGLWGCRGGGVPDMLEKINQWKKKSLKGNDQHFLLHEIYPTAVHDAVIHSDYIYFSGEQVESIPCERENPWDYLGCPIDPDHEHEPPENAKVLIDVLKKPLRKRKLPWRVWIKTRCSFLR